MEVMTGIGEAWLDDSRGSVQLGEAEPDDQPTTTVLERVLVQARDGLYAAPTPSGRSAAYVRGYTSAIRYARICVLDRIAAAAVDFIDDPRPHEIRQDRERLRTFVALRSIATRLLQELRADAEDDVAAGYRRGIVVALEVISDQERTVQQEPAATSGLREPIHVS